MTQARTELAPDFGKDIVTAAIDASESLRLFSKLPKELTQDCSLNFNDCRQLILCAAVRRKSFAVRQFAANDFANAKYGPLS